MPIEQTALDEFANDLAPAPAPAEPTPRIQPDVTNSLASEFLDAAPSSPRTTDARMAVSTALTTNADKYARANQLAKQYHVPGDFAERNLDWLENKAKVDGINELPQATKDALGNPHIAKLAHDDTENLSLLETTLAGISQATLGISSAIFDTPDTVGRVLGYGASLAERAGVPPDINPIRGAQSIANFIGHGVLPGGDKVMQGASDVASAISSAQTTLASNPDTFGQGFAALSARGQAADAAGKAAIGGDLGPLKEVLTDPQAWVGFISQAAPTLYTAIKSGGSLPFMGWLEGMSTSRNATEFEAKTGQKIDDATFALAFAETASVNALLERVGLDSVLGAKGGGIVSIVKGLVGEAGTEGLQQFNSNLAQSFFDPNTDLSAGVLASAMGGGGTGATVASVHQGIKKAHDAKVAKAEKAIKVAKAIEDTNKAAVGSLLKSRSPEDFANTLQQMAGADQDFYVDGGKLLEAIEKGGDKAAEALQNAPTVLEQLDEALPTNGSVRVPAKEFLTAFAGTGLDEMLIPHLRESEDAPSAAESEQFLQQQAEVIKTAAEAAMVKMADDQAFTDSAHAVEAKILADLTAANRWTADVNKTYAQLARDFVVTQAAREGITPEDFFARYSLRTVATPVEGLNQGNDNVRRDQRQPHPNHGRTVSGGTPDAGWENASGLKTRDGVPVFYRGSTAGTTAGSFSELGANTGHPSSGLGAWFTDSQPEAAKYGAKVEAFKLNLQHPKIYQGGDLPAFDSIDHAKAFAKDLQAQGFDGIVHDMRNLGGQVHAVAFSPDQAIYEQNDAPKGWDVAGNGSPNLAPGAGAKGAFNPKTLTISLLQNADLSTFLHELGHFQLTVLADMASRPNAPPGVVEDMNQLLEWFKVPDLAAWNAMSLEEQRPSHEKFARAFEAYLFEGKAPTLDLEGPFARIKSWMMRVYVSAQDILSRAGASLTPEVRGVFDRLLAAESDIKAAEEARSMLPLFDTRESFPGDDAAWQAYRDDTIGAHEAGAAQLQARSLRDMQWVANLRLRMLKSKQKEADATRKGVLADVVKDLSANPVYAVQDFLHGKELAENALGTLTRDQRRALTESGLSGLKLDLGMLKAAYGEDPAAPWRYLPTGKNGLVAENGTDPELVAKLFNYQSADEMVKDILAAPPREAAAEGEVDRRMLMEHGDLNDPRAIEDAVNEAIHNKVRTRVIATTLGALDTAVKNTRDMTRALRGMVKESMAQRRVGDIKPGRHVAAETRAAKEAKAALKAGDNKTAANSVRQQLWHNLSATEARAAEQEVARKIKYLRKFNGRVESIASDYQDRIDDLLERFDLRSRSETQIARSESLSAWLDKVEDERGVRPVVDPALESEAKRQNYQRMTLEEFRGLVDSVRSIEHMGRLKQKLLTARNERELDATAAALEKSAAENAPREITHGRGKYLAIEGLFNAGDRFLASHRKMSSLMGELDGFKPGLWSEVFLDPLNAAAANEAERMAASSKALIDMFKHVMKEGFVSRHTRTVVPGAVDRNGRPLSLSHEERLAAALNSGNEKNLQRLRDGDGWTDQTIKAIHTSLTEEDWQFVQSIWDHVASYRDQIGALEKDLTGVEPEWVDPSPFTVDVATLSVNGQALKTKPLTLRGGYYPIMYDTERSLTAVAFDTIADLSIMMRGARGKQTTRNGFTKRRAETVTGRPLSLKFNVLFKHINDVNHRLAWERTLYDTRQLLNRSEVKGALEKHLGPNATRGINDLMTEVAIGDLKVRDWFDEMADRLSANASLAIMGLNLMTAATQPLGLTQSVVEIGYGAVHDGVMTFYKDPANQIKRVDEKSAVMRTRALAWNQNITYLRNQLKGTGATVRNWAFIPMTYMQGAVDYPTWIGAYQQALGTGVSDADAVARADQAVLNSQGGGQTKDLAAAQRGKGAKALFTRFYNYANTTFQLVDRTIRRDKNSAKDYALAAHDLMLLTIVPTVLLVGLRALLMGGGPDDDESFAAKVGKETLAGILGLAVGGRELASVALGFDYQGPAGARLVPTLGKVVKQASQGEIDKPFLEALNMAAGLTFGYPATQVQRTVEGAAAIANGDTFNPAVLLFGPRKD